MSIFEFADGYASVFSFFNRTGYEFMTKNKTFYLSTCKEGGYWSGIADVCELSETEVKFRNLKLLSLIR